MRLALLLLLAAPTFAQKCADVRLAAAKDRPTWIECLPVKHRTFDWKFAGLAALSQAATSLDIENSMYALRRPGASESVPLFGRHPTRAKYYALAEPVWLGMTLFSYHYKRQDEALRDAGLPGHRFVKWWLPQALNIGFHGAGLTITLASTGR